MKKTLYLLLIPLCLLSCIGKQKQEQQQRPQTVELNAMTFNIRLDTPIDSMNNWKYRKDNAAQMIKEADVDILAMQEVMFNQLNDLKERLPEYSSVGVGRTDGKEAGEFSPVFYRKDKFKELESGTFWLSENPDSVGVIGWDAAYERIASWVILEDIASQKQFFALSTHFDHLGVTARNHSAFLILSKTRELAKDLPVIVMGDFNAPSDSEAIVRITDPGNPYRLINSSAIAPIIKGSHYTFQDFGRLPKAERPCIDYVFVNDKIKVTEYKVMPEKNDKGYFSDHSAVLVHLIIN